MMSEKELTAMKQYMIKELISYQDETFELLFRDNGGFTNGISNQVFGQQDRRISIYGVRGLGKTTAMQGALWMGLRKYKSKTFVPLNIVVANARGANSANELADVFYRAVILSVTRTAKAVAAKDEFMQAAKQYAPWVAEKITAVASTVFPPLAIAASLAGKGVEMLVKQSGQKSIDALLSSPHLNAQQMATILLDKLADSGGKPMFIIDELDKVENDAVLSEFFDANQAWFQGKQGMISLSYTFGEAMKQATLTSVSRISRIEKIPGTTSSEDAREVVRSRAVLGLSHIVRNEQEADRLFEKLIPAETITALVNVTAPNTYLMLEKMSSAIDTAIRLKASAVLPEHVEITPSEELRPTGLQLKILEQLGSGRLPPSVITERLRKDPGLVSRTLKKMIERNWVGKLGSGKQVSYYITSSGDSARRRGSK